MKERFRRMRETVKHIGVKSVALALAVLLIAVGIGVSGGEASFDRLDGLPVALERDGGGEGAEIINRRQQGVQPGGDQLGRGEGEGGEDIGQLRGEDREHDAHEGLVRPRLEDVLRPEIIGEGSRAAVFSVRGAANRC
ncbi:MAG: hypothetical protein K6G17_00610 [Oscillospiraceae bacterium]|nr:hypothetical protein [Oscillospiraceae bacterium]